MLIRHPEIWKLTSVPEGEWPKLERNLSPVSLKRGDFLVRPGEDPHRAAVVLKGLLRCYYVDRDGREATKAFRGPKEIVAAYSEMLQGIPSRTNIQAVEDCELLVVDFRRIVSLYDQHPCWQRLGRRIAEEHFIQKEQREFEFLQLSALERYRLFQERYPGLSARIPQYHIASYLGITAVALSRLKAGGSSRRRPVRKAGRVKRPR
jgi:CRP-like cAMP-binding protein